MKEPQDWKPETDGRISFSCGMNLNIYDFLFFSKKFFVFTLTALTFGDNALNYR